eukprot:CAMPEP_0113941578 /NCGR_PEP_ID=MMETSP1339-20121228/7464_1 /TAXON_ID=94617 /ORGANISM="Fibrocapsa japonica" /LENGTH=270 /DNA_ID=CAMNT_0000945761 /DNA_START=28 /DNA_END=840 /DNA_ORIENTATION=+ /assembly_acc=CAM_ASM_000762
MTPGAMADAYFLLPLVPSMLVILVVSSLLGLLCRRLCPVDFEGYILTSKRSWFKVNYTRRLQNLLMYLVPLLCREHQHSSHGASLGLAWDLWGALLCLTCLIKPLRENFTWFMLQFNSVDCPEDRPNTLLWMILGNILPGYLLMLLFECLFTQTGQRDLLYILIISTCVGDGLSEPVGMFFGQHKYTVVSWNARYRYRRTWEGSACTFFVTMLVIALSYATFKEAYQFFACMFLVPAMAAALGAISPHTMGTPIMMAGCGLFIYLVITIL